MPSGEVTIRRTEERDAAAVVRLQMDTNPTLVMTPETWVHRRLTIPKRAQELPLVAEVAGEIVGYGLAGFNYGVPGSTTAHVYVTVAEGHRRRGIGGQVYKRLDTHAHVIGGTARQVMLFERPEATAFAAARGFVEARVAYPATVDPRTLELEPPADVELASFADVDPRALHRVDEEASKDEPAVEPMESFPYEEWLDETLRHPGVTTEGSFVALVDGVPSSFSMLYVAPASRRASNGFTATLRAHRGRGLALACKIAALRWAAASGYESVVTANDDTNAPMLAINRRLGYRPIGRLVTMRAE